MAMKIRAIKLQCLTNPVFKSPTVLVMFFMVCLLILPVLTVVCRADDWTPPSPTGNDGFDWIELKSGEWLKGRIKSMQQEKLEFDSEELDVHTWDWRDIRTVRSSRMQSMRFGDKEVIDGALLITGNKVQVVNAAGTNTFPRAKLLAITPTGNRERDKWSMDISLGMSSRQGNVSEVSNNSHFVLRRQTPLTRQEFEYIGNYGKIDGVVNKDDQRFLVNSDFYLTRQFFIRAPDLEYFHDAQQNIADRYTLGGSVGYDLIRTPRTELEFTLGPAYQRNIYTSVEPGTSTTASSLALVLGSTFDIELTKRLDFLFEYRGQFTSKATGSNLHHTMATLEFEIHKHLTLDLSLVWDRIAKSETGADGVKPKSDDLQFITSLGIHF